MPAIPIRLDATRTFHESTGAEASGGSVAAPRGGVVTFGSQFGGTGWVITALSHDARVLKQWGSKDSTKGGLLRTANNTNQAIALPEGTRSISLEGQADNDGTRPWANYWIVP